MNNSATLWIVAVVAIIVALAIGYEVGHSTMPVTATSTAPVVTSSTTTVTSSSSNTPQNTTGPVSTQSSAGAVSSQAGATTVTAAPGGTKYTLGVGQSVSADGFTVTLVGVTEDTRCPAGEQCSQAGTVQAQVRIAKGPIGTTQTLTLGVPISEAGVTGELVAVSPEAQASQTIAQSAYTCTFEIWTS